MTLVIDTVEEVYPDQQLQMPGFQLRVLLHNDSGQIIKYFLNIAVEIHKTAICHTA